MAVPLTAHTFLDEERTFRVTLPPGGFLRPRSRARRAADRDLPIFTTTCFLDALAPEPRVTWNLGAENEMSLMVSRRPAVPFSPALQALHETASEPAAAEPDVRLTLNSLPVNDDGVMPNPLCRM